MKESKTIVQAVGGAGLATAVLLAVGITPLHAGDKKNDANDKKAKERPGYVVVEEDFWLPPYYAPTDWFHSAEFHYRRHEEKAAANELRNAETWLKYAAGHALPETRKTLDDAAVSLHAMAGKIEAGEIIGARKFDDAMARANRALAEWHYFQADAKLAKNDEKNAAQHLQAAARYLKDAADSANFEYGDEFVTFYDDIFGWTVKDAVPNTLTKNLDTVKSELDKLAVTLRKDADS